MNTDLKLWIQNAHAQLLLKVSEIKSKFPKKLSPMQMVVALAILFVLAFIWDQSRLTSSDSHGASPEAETDTYIPAGFVLVPIQVANFESLDSILGQYGVVDLYEPGPTAHERARKIASRVKILRAPKNPSQFAILSPEDQSADLVRHEGAFFVVIQNRKKIGAQIQSRLHTNHVSRISIGVNNANQDTRHEISHH